MAQLGGVGGGGGLAILGINVHGTHFHLAVVYSFFCPLYISLFSPQFDKHPDGSDGIQTNSE